MAEPLASKETANGRPLELVLPQGNGPNGIATKRVDSLDSIGDSIEANSRKQPKSVHFSPETTTLQLSAPPRSTHPFTDGSVGQQSTDGSASRPKGLAAAPATSSSAASDGDDLALDTGPIVNKEHLQLTPEEAFFLSFGLGALSVLDPVSGSSLSTRDMLKLFRQYSSFPPRTGTGEAGLGPDDKFLLHYAVYHHFRSLGWVPRAGIKFGVDWLLYAKGPVFDHAEFGLVVIPSYADPRWKTLGKQGPQKTWHWLHGIVRVLSHVTKSLVLMYVDVPPPPIFDEALEAGITEALSLYRVREVTVKRWSSNRNR